MKKAQELYREFDFAFVQNSYSASMLVTANWINDYLKNDVPADLQAELLTAAGFPLEGRDDLSDGDVRQDFEMTSNRGDCTCHIGLAREIAARTDNTLVLPDCSVEEIGPPVQDSVTVTNLEHELCPLYTARVILGATVTSSPEWLKTKIENRGDIPRNAIVDATNFVLFEQGQPTHVFDLDKIVGNQIIVRRAKEGEKFLPLGEDAVELKLTSDDLVIADAEKPVALAGVKGGALASVTEDTTNLLIEAATFNPIVVREMSRRHKIASDSSFRFERGVSPTQVESSANRLAAILIDVGGGELCEGVVSDGNSLPEQITTSMRTAYCNERLGTELRNEQMVEYLQSVGFDATCTDDTIACTVPYYRGDIHREIDLVEEIGRVYGFENFDIEESVEVRVPPSGGEVEGRQTILNSLAGMGFIECVTHSLISTNAANHFLLDGQSPLTIDDDRATAEPALRPSIIPSLLTVRKHNEDNGVKNVQLAELGSVFVVESDEHCERTELGILLEANEGDGIGKLRGVVNRVCSILSGKSDVEVIPCSAASWLDPGGRISVGGVAIGRIGRLSSTVQKEWDLPATFYVAQLHLGALLSAFPPEVQSHSLPTQPAIERDLSLIVHENILWCTLIETISSLSLENLEDILYVTTFRGKNIEEGKKSVTLRLRFRDEKRTLTHDEVNEPVSLAVNALVKECDAEIRST
jgi:phenylalanyl-tRNA synthetase beta chain